MTYIAVILYFDLPAPLPQVICRVSILVILALEGYGFSTLVLNWVGFLKKLLSHIIDKTIIKNPS